MLTVLSRLLLGSFFFVVIMQDTIALAIFAALAFVCAIAAFLQAKPDDDLAKPPPVPVPSRTSDEAATEKATEVEEGAATQKKTGTAADGDGKGESGGDVGVLQQMLAAAKKRGSDGLKGVNGTLKAALEEAEKLVEKIKDETQPQWEPLADTDGIKVLSHATLKNCTIAVFTVQADAMSILDVLEDVDMRREWDPLMEESRVVKILNNATRLSYLRTKVQWPTSARDQVVLAHGQVQADGSFLVLCKSVEDPALPAEKGCVRADVKLVAYLLDPLGSDGARTKVRAISYVDPKGYIPTRLLTWVNSVAVPAALSNLQRRAKKVAASRAVAGSGGGGATVQVAASAVDTELQMHVDRMKREVTQLRSKLEGVQRLSLSNVVLLVVMALFMLRNRRVAA